MQSETTIAAIGQKVAYGGGGMALVCGLTANELAAISGIAIGLAGLLVQVVFKRRSDHREKELHAANMARLRDNPQHHRPQRPG